MTILELLARRIRVACGDQTVEIIARLANQTEETPGRTLTIRTGEMSHDGLIRRQVNGLLEGHHSRIIWSEHVVVGKQEHFALALVIGDPFTSDWVG